MNIDRKKLKKEIVLLEDVGKFKNKFIKKIKQLKQKLKEERMKIDDIITDEIMKYQATKINTQVVREVKRCRNSIIALEILQHRIKEKTNE